MNNRELARIKLDRAYRLLGEYDELSAEDVKIFLLNLMHAVELYPSENPQRSEVYTLLRSVINMKIEKYGYVFKATNWKHSKLLGKNEAVMLFKNVVSLMQ